MTMKTRNHCALCKRAEILLSFLRLASNFNILYYWVNYATAKLLFWLQTGIFPYAGSGNGLFFADASSISGVETTRMAKPKQYGGEHRGAGGNRRQLVKDKWAVHGYISLGNSVGLAISAGASEIPYIVVWTLVQCELPCQLEFSVI